MQAATDGTSQGDSPDSSGVDTLHPLLGAGQYTEPDSGQTNPALNFSGGLRHSEGHDQSDPNATFETLKALRGRAYVSPVKLRQLSRNVQDLQTRLELRRMQTEVDKQERSERAKEYQSTFAAGHKQNDRRNLSARRHDCAQKTGASKSKACSLLKSGDSH